MNKHVKKQLASPTWPWRAMIELAAASGRPKQVLNAIVEIFAAADDFGSPAACYGVLISEIKRNLEASNFWVVPENRS